MATKPKRCPECGNEFAGRTRYCLVCRPPKPPPMQRQGVCDWCGKEFAGGHGNRRYCPPPAGCQAAATNQRYYQTHKGLLRAQRRARYQSGKAGEARELRVGRRVGVQGTLLRKSSA